MSGYTPVFKSIFQGTLCGQYPDTAAWLFFLALADKNGHVDMTPQFISAVTGMPVDDLTACIERFMQPDPNSRSSAEEGRRLVLVDPARSWGWRIVNHDKYREKARLAAKNAEAVSAGKEAERKRHARDVSAGVRRCPPVSDPSDADADTDYREQLRSTSERSFRPSSSERARADGTISKREFRRRQFKAAVADLADQKAIP